MNEFDLIAQILAELAETTGSSAVRVGPGDDAAVINMPEGAELVSSIDALVADVHFPPGAGASLVGYRAVMVSLSDLAAMGADPGFALVALTLPELDVGWSRGLARGMAAAARVAAVPIIGGNIARGPLAITVSVHGWAPLGASLIRGGAQPGDQIYVTGALGGAAAALAQGGLDECKDEDQLDALQRRYFLPQARLEEGVALRGHATSVIDVSDGLLQDLEHVCRQSNVRAEISSAHIPLAVGALLDHALTGGDDYELCFTSAQSPERLGVPVTRIGSIVTGSGVALDGRSVNAAGYQHFQ